MEMDWEVPQEALFPVSSRAHDGTASTSANPRATESDDRRAEGRATITARKRAFREEWIKTKKEMLIYQGLYEEFMVRASVREADDASLKDDLRELAWERDECKRAMHDVTMQLVDEVNVETEAAEEDINMLHQELAKTRDLYRAQMKEVAKVRVISGSITKLRIERDKLKHLHEAHAHCEASGAHMRARTVKQTEEERELKRLREEGARYKVLYEKKTAKLAELHEEKASNDRLQEECDKYRRLYDAQVLLSVHQNNLLDTLRKWES